MPPVTSSRSAHSPGSTGSHVATKGSPSDAAGREIHADNVVLCTGTFGRTPHVPSFADQLDPSIRQLHSSEYRRATQLPDGPVLVVGASHSGCDIAYEVAATHPTVLCGPDTGQIPVAFDSPLFKVVFPTMLFVFRNVLKRTNPVGRKAKAHFRHGGPRLRVQERDLAARGVDWVVGHVVGTVTASPCSTTVTWSTSERSCGARASVRLSTGSRRRRSRPTDGRSSYAGWPTRCPACTSAASSSSTPRSSMLIQGAGRDGAYVADRIGERHLAQSRTRSKHVRAA